MNRWTRRAALALLGLISSVLAHAQTLIREAPRDVRPAIIEVSATPPLIALNGAPARLSPGVRIRDLRNMLVLPATLAGQTVHTVYRLDSSGLVHEVWLLTREEYAKLGGRAPLDAESLRRFNELLATVFRTRP